MGLFDFFSGKERIYTPSLYFLNHPLKDKYFYRTMSFHYLNDEITVVAVDNKSPTVFTFDPWPQQIFLSATGNITVYDFLVQMAKRYQGKVPEQLDKTIIEELERLVGKQIIYLSDEPVELDAKLLQPIQIKK
jgi:hypothetical protein